MLHQNLSLGETMGVGCFVLMLVAGATACDEAGHVSMTVTVTTDQYSGETGSRVERRHPGRDGKR